jgi:hypothetical protein
MLTLDYKKLFLVVIFIAFFVVFLTNIEKYIVKNVDVSRYIGSNAHDVCLNYIQDNDPSSIIIGTSVVRELTNESNSNVFKKTLGYNCGISSPVVDLSFHFTLANLAIDRAEKLKKIFIGISMHDLLSNNYLDVKKQGIGMHTIFSSLNLYNKDYINLSVLYDSLLNYLFPLARFDLNRINKEIKVKTRKNSDIYKTNIFDKSKVKDTQLQLIKENYNSADTIKKLNDLSDLEKKYGVEVVFVLLPQNRDFIDLEISDQMYNLIMDDFFNNTRKNLDYRNIISSNGFADCCHMNNKGRVDFETAVSDL